MPVEVFDNFVRFKASPKRVPIDFLAGAIVFFFFGVTILIILPPYAPVVIKVLFPGAAFLLCGFSFWSYANRFLLTDTIQKIDDKRILVKRRFRNFTLISKSIDISNAKVCVAPYPYRRYKYGVEKSGYTCRLTYPRTFWTIRGNYYYLGGFLTLDEARAIANFLLGETDKSQCFPNLQNQSFTGTW